MINKKEEKLNLFDPSSMATNQGKLFGLPFNKEESEFIVIPAPWEVTVSYGSGTSKSINSIIEASYQIDLMNQRYPELWKLGIFNLEQDAFWEKQAKILKEKSKHLIELLENNTPLSANHLSLLNTINETSDTFNTFIENQTIEYLKQNKQVILLGGDHSTPLGYYKALEKTYGKFGILQIDAHMDLRKAYQGFKYSHASIMYNTLKETAINKLIQVGIRDFCQEEYLFYHNNKNRISIWSDQDIANKLFKGESWQSICLKIVEQLPDQVCISVDIDGFSKLYCPNTGTPVVGGITYQQFVFLIETLIKKNKTIIGFDLVEIAPNNNQEDNWDANVGARLLYELSGAMAKSLGYSTGNALTFN